jgi:hypothetical protein
MGFWGGLGKIGAVAAAPFTGGMSLAAIPAIDAIGQVAGGAAGGMAQGRQVQDQQNISRDRNAIDLYNSQISNAEKLPQSLTSQAMRADIIKNLQNRQITGLPDYIHVPKMTGGLQPSLLGDQSRQAAGMMGNQAISRLGQFGQQGLPQAPQMSQVSKPGFFEKLLGGVGVGGSMLGAMKKPQSGAK